MKSDYIYCIFTIKLSCDISYEWFTKNIKICFLKGNTTTEDDFDLSADTLSK